MRKKTEKILGLILTMKFTFVYSDYELSLKFLPFSNLDTRDLFQDIQ